MSEIAGRLTTALADRYRIERELGAGGMATVYLANDLKHDRKVAIKVLRPELAAALGHERFLLEITTTANLRHPHILPLYDSGETDEFLFYVMPYVEGESLRDRLDREKQLPLDEALQIAREVADALSYAHSRGVIHRDVKPENILLESGHAVVADFGIARAVDAAGGERLTETGMSIGTPSYMSPEQAAGERELDGRSDLYALACVLYEMLGGQPPFTGPSVESVVHQHLTVEPPSITNLRPTVPAAVAAALRRALAKTPADRFNPVAQFSEALGSRELQVRPPRAQDTKSLAVLPFANVGADPENEYFADGLTEELITDLAQVRALRVISRTSSMRLKGTNMGMREIGLALDVRYALEGSVRKAGNSLRITAQLIDTHSDARLWADKYTGTMDDVFELQERVSRAIVKALDVTLSSDEEVRLTDRPIRQVRAFELYLQARQELRHYHIDRAAPLLQQAIAIEGEVPALRALRAMALVTQVRAGMHRDLRPLEEAEREARALIEIAPDAAYGYALLGFVGYERGMLQEAVRNLRAAMERDPTDADVHFFLGISLIGAGQYEAGEAVSRRLAADDPLSPMAPQLAGVVTWFPGRAAEGLEASVRSIEMDSESLIQQWTVGYHYALVGRIADTARHAEFMHQRAPLMPYTVQLRALVAAVEGRQEEALEMLAKVDASVLDGHTRFHLGEAFAMAGDSARALELVEDAVNSNFYPYDYIAWHDPFVEPIRAHAAFARIAATAKRRVEEFRA